MSLEPASRVPNRSLESLRSQVRFLQQDLADRGKEIDIPTPSSCLSPAGKPVLTKILVSTVRKAKELHIEAERRNFLLGLRDLKCALADAAGPPGNAEASSFFQRLRGIIQTGDELAEQFGREWRASFSSDAPTGESDEGDDESTAGSDEGGEPIAPEEGGKDDDPCAEEKKLIVELTDELTRLSATCDSLGRENRKKCSEAEALEKGLQDLERQMPRRNLSKSQLALADCERHQSELYKKILRLRGENGRLRDIAKRYKEWFTKFLPGDAAERLISDAGASRLRLAELEATLAAKTAQTHALWTEKGLSARSLTKKKQEWKGIESQMKAVTAMARSLMCCEDFRIELYNAKIALQALKDENEALLRALHKIVPYELPPGAGAAKKKKVKALKARLAAIKKKQHLADEEDDRLNKRLRSGIKKVVEGAHQLEDQRARDLESHIEELTKQLADSGPTANAVRLWFLNKHIAKIKGLGSDLASENQELLADLRAERVLLMPDGKLRAYAIALQKEAIPPLPVLSDAHFQQEWEALFLAVSGWCSSYYSFSAESPPVSYDELVRSGHPLGFYLREVLVHRDYVERLVPNFARPYVATGIVFRILVEEIFEPLRFVLHLRFQEPKERWMIKPQYKAAFESEDMADSATAPRFQSRESFLQRRGKRPSERYQHPETWEFLEPHRKRVKRDYFNFFKTFEDSELEGIRDNGDDIALNMARAKLMTSIFSLKNKNNPSSSYAEDLRSKVSALIASTLRPLSGASHPGKAASSSSSSSSSCAADRPAHASELKRLVEEAFDLAVQMACQPALVHPLATDLMSMKAFDSTCMTIANHPIERTTSKRGGSGSSSGGSRRADVDSKYSAVAKQMVDSRKAGKVGCHFRPVCEVMPALVRRGGGSGSGGGSGRDGQVTRGGYSWSEKVVVAKAKVYVGGPDETGSKSNLKFTIHTFPYGLEGL